MTLEEKWKEAKGKEVVAMLSLEATELDLELWKARKQADLLYKDPKLAEWKSKALTALEYETDDTQALYKAFYKTRLKYLLAKAESDCLYEQIKTHRARIMAKVDTATYA